MKKILIVEDDIAIAEIETDFLEINGFEVSIEKDGIAGLNQIKSGKYDLVLLDLMLPGIVLSVKLKAPPSGILF